MIYEANYTKRLFFIGEHFSFILMSKTFFILKYETITINGRYILQLPDKHIESKFIWTYLESIPPNIPKFCRINTQMWKYTNVKTHKNDKRETNFLINFRLKQQKFFAHEIDIKIKLYKRSQLLPITIFNL